MEIGATHVEGITLEIGEWALVEGTTVSIGATLVEGPTLEIGEWRTTMPLLLEPSSNSIDSTGIKKQLQ